MNRTKGSLEKARMRADEACAYCGSPIFSGEWAFLDTEGEGVYCTKECFGLHLDFCEGEARKEAERRARESVISALRSIIRRVNHHPRLEALPGELWDEAMRREENIRVEEARKVLEGESHEG